LRAGPVCSLSCGRHFSVFYDLYYKESKVGLAGAPIVGRGSN
jgi:hypothetical protein